jgi:hypothetical protein
MKDRPTDDPPEVPAHDLLPDELLWAEGGHASDVVLTALADGEAGIVPTAVRQHVERCAACTTHLGHAALLSIHAEAELGTRKELDARVAPPARVPRVPVALGLVAAALGLLPSLLDEDSALLPSRVPLLLHGARTLARRLYEPDSSAGIALTYATALVLVVLGLAATRILPKKEPSR